MGSTSWNRPEIVKIIKTTESFKEFDCLLYKSIKNNISKFQLVLFNHDGVCVLGRVENRNSWKITKPQVDPIDAHKNETICMIERGLVSKTALEYAEIGSTRPL